MNPNHCFTMGKCPFVRMCWDGDPRLWYDPPDEFLHCFVDKDEDYVTAKEDMGR